MWSGDLIYFYAFVPAQPVPDPNSETICATAIMQINYTVLCMDLKSYVNISKPRNRLRCLHCNYTSQYKSTGIGSWKFLALKSSLARTHACAHWVYENLDVMHAIKCTTPTLSPCCMQRCKPGNEAMLNHYSSLAQLGLNSTE